MELDGDKVRVTFGGHPAGDAKAELLRRWDADKPASAVPCTITLGTSPHYVWAVTEERPAIARCLVTLWESEWDALRHAESFMYASESGLEWSPWGDPEEQRWRLTDKWGVTLRRVSIARMVPGRGAQ